MAQRFSSIPLAARAWWALSALALGVAAVALAGGFNTPTPNVVVLAGGSSAAPVPTSTQAPALVHASHLHRAQAAPPSPLTTPRSRPVMLDVPTLGIHVALGMLGILPNGQVQVPTTRTAVGWYDQGPTPGQIGSAVLLGHVDSYRGIGTFFYLKTMQPGQAIDVTLADGLVAHFAVTKVVQYAKSAFPTRLVFGYTPTPTLQLVTCGGAFDYSTGHYLANIVVFSHLVSVSKAVN